MSESESNRPSDASSRRPSFSVGDRIVIWCGVLFFLLLIGLAIGLRFWNFEKSGEFSTPARPPTLPSYEPGPGLPKGYEQIVAIPTTSSADSVRQSSLVNELARQAVLIAAEEGLGLSTFDESFGARIPSSKSPESFPVLVQLVTPFKINRQSKPGNQRAPEERLIQIEITRHRPGGPQFRWTTPELTVPSLTLIESVAEHVNQLAYGPFVEMLEKAGFQKSSSSAINEAESNVNLDEHLDLASQFALLRQLHSKIHIRGASPESLGALVRSYANLGSLTDFHWSSSSKAFKARSLIYAERLITQFGKTPFSHAHRAYALALAGRHKTALEAVTAARSARGMDAPQWLDLINAYCLFRPEDIDPANGPQRELAMYLRMRMSDVVNDASRALAGIDQFLDFNPACSRAVEMIGEAQSLAVEPSLIERRYRRMWPVVYQRIAAILSLPADAVEMAASAAKTGDDVTVDEYTSRRKLIDFLCQSAPPRGVPSWSTLGKLLDDDSFVQAWRVLNVEANWLKVDCTQSLKELKPLYKGHRLAKFLESFAGDRQQSQQVLQDILEHLEWNSLDITSLPIVREVQKKLPKIDARPLIVKLESHSDELYDDYGPKRPSESNVTERATRLLEISPHWPLTIALAIKSNQDKIVPIEERERNANEIPLVLNVVANRYLDMGRPQDAVRCLRKLIDIAPSDTGCRTLANAYREEGDFQNWCEALKKGLDAECFGMETAAVHAELATAYMRHGMWDIAEPHAAAAAQSNTESGLQTAARCAEGQQKWELAEEFVRDVSVRYQNRSADWYFWCVRAGRGDLDAAEARAMDFWKSRSDEPSRERDLSVATWQIVTGELSLAQSTLTDVFLRFEDVTAGTMAAVLADLRGNTLERDALFKQIALHWIPPEGYYLRQEIPEYRGRRKRTPFPELTNLMRGFIKEGRWNPNEFEALVMESDKPRIPYLYFLAGTFLAHHDRKELGHQYLRCAISYPRLHSPISVLATYVLRADGASIPAPQLSEVPDSIASAVSKLKRSIDALQKLKLDMALAVLNDLHQQFPEFLPGLVARGKVYEARGNYAAAIGDYQEALRMDPDYPSAHYKLAWLLSDCDLAEFRDGKKALEHAGRFVSHRQFDTYASVSTLAVAIAESGDLEAAVRLEKQAISLPGILNQTSDPYMSYLSNKPYRRLPPSKLFVDEILLEIIDYDL